MPRDKPFGQSLICSGRRSRNARQGDHDGARLEAWRVPPAESASRRHAAVRIEARMAPTQRQRLGDRGALVFRLSVPHNTNAINFFRERIPVRLVPLDEPQRRRAPSRTAQALGMRKRIEAVQISASAIPRGCARHRRRARAVRTRHRERAGWRGSRRCRPDPHCCDAGRAAGKGWHRSAPGGDAQGCFGVSPSTMACTASCRAPLSRAAAAGMESAMAARKSCPLWLRSRAPHTCSPWGIKVYSSPAFDRSTWQCWRRHRRPPKAVRQESGRALPLALG